MINSITAEGGVVFIYYDENIPVGFA